MSHDEGYDQIVDPEMLMNYAMAFKSLQMAIETKDLEMTLDALMEIEDLAQDDYAAISEIAGEPVEDDDDEDNPDLPPEGLEETPQE